MTRETNNLPGAVPIVSVDGLTRGRMACELDRMKDSGVSEIVARPDSSLADFKALVEEAQARAIGVWIHDDISRAVPDRPEFQAKHLEIKVTAREDIDLSLFSPGDFMVAVRMQGGQATRTRVLPGIAAVESLDECWRVFNCRIRTDPTSIDTLSELAVRRHIEQTLESIFDALGDAKSAIVGVAAESPCICSGPSARDGWTIPYTDDLFACFEARFERPALSNLPYLFFPGHNAPEFRADFWEHIAAVFSSRCHSAYASWCKSYSLSYTVLYSAGESLRSQMRCRGNAFLTLNACDIPSSGPSTVQAKIASAHTTDDKNRRVISSLSCQPNIKSEINRLVTLGINTFVAPWQDIAPVCDYVTRLNKLLSKGVSLRTVAVLFPTSGLYAAYQPDRKTEEFEAIDSVLGSLVIELAKRQLDYDIIDFAALVDPERIAKYDALIVPYTPYMRLSEYQTIERVSKTLATCVLYRSMDRAPMNVPSTNRGIRFVPTEELQGFVMRLRHAIDDGAHLYGYGREDILLMQRRTETGRLAFITNQGGIIRHITARFQNTHSLAATDPETGGPIAHTEKAEIDLTLEPAGSAVVIVDQK